MNILPARITLNMYVTNAFLNLIKYTSDLFVHKYKILHNNVTGINKYKYTSKLIIML